MKNLSIFFLLFFCLYEPLTAQRSDTSFSIGGITGDTSLYIRTNIPKSKFWGNSWYVAASYQWCKSHEFDFNLGRTYGKSSGGGGGSLIEMRSWGAGYGIANRQGQQSQFIKAFWEYSFFYFPPIAGGIRADYVYDLTNNSHYFRPSLGLSLFFIDLYYSYSFKLSGSENIFKHGLTIRLKYFFPMKNWQDNSIGVPRF